MNADGSGCEGRVRRIDAGAELTAAGRNLRLILVRHGETLWNVDRRIQGHLDVELSPVGHAQAGRLARRLASGSTPPHGAGLDVATGTLEAGWLVDAVIASDLARARQTAEPLAAALGLPIRFDAAWRERHFGLFQGMSHADMVAGGGEVLQRWQRLDPTDDFDDGESFLAFVERIDGALNRLVSAHAGQCVMVVTHGGVLDVIYRRVTAQPFTVPRTCALPNAGISCLTLVDGRWSIACWGVTDHLDDSLDDAAVR